ncbi:hypothetical protein [Azospirillum sp. TSO22-1]|uniref:hypothetical protein n=1 Tax=Azospirillum sp. TSO22-1 TaxID=716789 RepID=UPI000D605EA0|nr:hypothetical protein [Azospirillum sp. TSO22-1]PWC35267.1 hypothetical protein TSO221_30065 [Azospirillum sp. TSO22-1]
MARPHRTDPPEPAPEDLDLARLSPEEIAFLLGGAPEEGERERLLRAERNARANARRTARRATDAEYAERLRAGDRDRQRRRRAGATAGAMPGPSEQPVPLPAISLDEAARRLAEHLRESDTAQARQLRARPDLVRRYVAGFAAYRLLSVAGARPTRGALAEALRDRFGLELTPPQVQKLRDHVESFARPGGPWHAG